MRFALVFCAWLLLASTAWGEVFELANGERLEGELVNPNESPRRTYVIQLPKGARLTLEKDQVKGVVRRRPEHAEYERIRPQYADTIDGNWALAEWCREHTMLDERRAHMERILELDSNHALARRALGYMRVGKEWKTADQVQIERGFVKYKGKWMLPQQIELVERKRKDELAEKEWKGKLKRWYGWLATPRSGEAAELIAAIDDPYAVKALEGYLRKERRDGVRKLFIESLANVGSPAAWQALAVTSLEDENEDVRLTCLDYLDDEPRPAAVEYYVSRLRDKRNEIINRSAIALARMNDKSAIGPLITALITTHKFKIQTAPPGSTTTTFSNDGSVNGFSAGSSSWIETRKIQNEAVLDALVVLSEGVSFNFDIKAWKDWLAARKRPATLDARRD